MKLLSNPNKYISVLLLFFISFLPQSRLQAADCPTLTKKTLDLCNPTREEVAEGLGTPIAIIDGVRAVGSPDPSNDEFFSSIKGQEYTFKWIFKDGKGNEIVSGCEQTFELNDKEAPTCGAATLKVHGKGVISLGWVTREVMKSEFKNQKPTWSDNCTPTDDIEVNFNDSNITSDKYRAHSNNSVNVQYTLTDHYGHITTCNQTLIADVNDNYECPNVKPVSVEVSEGSCKASCESVQNEIRNIELPIMDGTGNDISPEATNGKVNIYYNNTGSRTCPDNFHPGSHLIYFYYAKSAKKYCPVTIIVKENSNPPSCPKLADITLDKASLTADEIETSIKGLINQYGEQLDNCTPNANLDVIYSGGNLSAPYCGTISYALSDFGKMRSCTAKVILPQCPNLPALTKKYCDYNNQPMPKQQLVDFLNSNKPSLTYCANKVEGVYDASKLSKSYSNGSHPSIEWKFSFNGITKNCSQTINIQRDNNLSCVGKDVTLNAESNCMASGAGVPLPTVTACDNSYSLKWFKLSENTYNNATRHSISELNGTSFQDNDVIIWALYYDESCRSNITVVDNTKPTCTNPSLGKLTGKCSFTRSEVEAKMPNTDKLGTDNCGIKSAAIDWDQTAFETFTSNSDGSTKSYDIYYTITDNSDLTNDGFCIATIEVEGIPAPNCPDTEVYALSLDGTAEISLNKDAEWSLKSPSSITFNAGKLTGLSFGKDNNIELEARWCDAFKKVCPTTVKLIKAVPPCKD